MQQHKKRVLRLVLQFRALAISFVIANTVYPMLVHMASETGFTEADLAEGETMNGTNVYRNLIPVTSANVEDFYSK